MTDNEHTCEVCGAPATYNTSSFLEPPGTWHWYCALHFLPPDRLPEC